MPILGGVLLPNAPAAPINVVSILHCSTINSPCVVTQSTPNMNWTHIASFAFESTKFPHSALNHPTSYGNQLQFHRCTVNRLFLAASLLMDFLSINVLRISFEIFYQERHTLSFLTITCFNLQLLFPAGLMSYESGFSLVICSCAPPRVIGCAVLSER
jgi:hypothetical protein